MKLYKTMGQATEDRGDASSWITKWDGTQADARASRKQMNVDLLSNVETKEVDVPTDKPGLLAWLNAHCVGE